MSKRIGTVYLRVANIDRQLAFYQQIIGLQLHRKEGNTVFLGTGADDLLALIRTPDGVSRRGQNGLYHFALLLPTREYLARALNHLMTTQTPLQGVSDHIVSEAVYLADPEGNGIELYADRPREHWYRNGVFQLATLPLDVADLLGTITPPASRDYSMPSDTIMGHIHLHVDAIPTAIAFYRDVMGMQLMAEMSSAAFLSYDGYHHHIGVNTWAGQISHADDRLGLDHFTLLLDEIHKYLAQRSSGGDTDAEDWIIDDPSANRMVVQQL